jgi:hypothetical protein
MQQVTRWRFTVHDYHRMGEAGILHEDDGVELIEGELVEMAAIGTRHFSCVNRLTLPETCSPCSKPQSLWHVPEWSGLPPAPRP